MEANVFRALGSELGPRLVGKRIDKVFQPSPDHWAFQMGAGGGTEFLLLHPSRRDALLFSTCTKTKNPLEPSPRAMWFRKRLTGRRVIAWTMDWPSRRLALALSQGEGRFFVLDLRSGPELREDLAGDAFGREPEWPSPEAARTDSGIWREYPQISPPLRRLLAKSDISDAGELLTALARNPAPTIYVRCRDDYPVGIQAWMPGGGADHSQEKAASERFIAFDDACEAARIYGEPRYFSQLEKLTTARSDLLHASALKKLEKTLRRLDQDEARLREMIGMGRQAEALQVRLHEFAGEMGVEQLTLEHPDGQTVGVFVKPDLTALENMQRMFRLASKGKRGLEAVARRRGEVREELGNLRAGKTASRMEQPLRDVRDHAGRRGKHKGLAVHRYRTSDGFTVLRGRNSKANHGLLSRLASPFDLWFHAAGVSGAHVVLKKSYPDQVVPRESIREAAVLAGLASGFKGALKAEVHCALVKDVRKIKGAEHGVVRVREIEETLLVELDETMEKKLKIG